MPDNPLSNIDKLAAISSRPQTIDREWCIPLAIPKQEIVVDPLPPSLVPEALRPWLEDSSIRMGVPLEMLAIPALVGLSVVTGRRAAIQPKKYDSGWIEIPNLWGAVVAPPGSLKSPSMTEAFRPLSEIERAQTDLYCESLAESKINEEAIKSESEAFKEKLKQSFKSESADAEANRSEIKRRLIDLEEKKDVARLPIPRLTVHDATVEKLVEIHRDNPLGILLKRDELMGFLTKLDQEGRESDRAFFLESWSGNQRFISDRIGRGTVQVDAVCVAIFGTIQPQPLSNYFAPVIEGKGSGDGLLQRFSMLVYPNLNGSIWRNNDQPPDEMAYRRACEVYQRIFECREVGLTLSQTPTVMRFSDEAQQLFDTWREEIENRLLCDADVTESPAFHGHLGKYRKLLPSLALLFHLAERASGKSNGEHVSKSATILAVHWVGFLEKHARKVYAGTLQPDLAAAHELVRRIKDRSVQSGVTIREIYRKEWRGLSSQKLVRSGLRILEDLEWLRVEEERGLVGPNREVVRLNPNLQRAPTPS